jgi:hypothetical protein
VRQEAQKAADEVAQARIFSFLPMKNWDSIWILSYLPTVQFMKNWDFIWISVMIL